jgi:hypothetical protein
MIGCESFPMSLPDFDRLALAAAIRGLERPSFAGRLAALAGKPVGLVQRALPAAASTAVANTTKPLALSPGGDLIAGAGSGIATALVGMAGPPALIYLLLAGAGATTIRATLLAFFALAYGQRWFPTLRRSVSRPDLGRRRYSRPVRVCRRPCRAADR